MVESGSSNFVGWVDVINPYKVVRDFESALCEYTGAPYCVTVSSCTMALLLAVAYHYQRARWFSMEADRLLEFFTTPFLVEIPKLTYIGVPISITHGGGKPIFRDEQWIGAYQLWPLPVIDSARCLYAEMYKSIAERVIGHAPGQAILGNGMVCLSFHHTKHLGISTHGGAILHDDPELDVWLRRARFDGRAEGVDPKDDTFTVLGYHCYMTPPTAAEGLQRLASLPKHNEPLPWGPGTDSDYTDLSVLEIFK